MEICATHFLGFFFSNPFFEIGGIRVQRKEDEDKGGKGAGEVGGR